MQKRRGILIGGYASLKFYYYPLKNWLAERGLECDILPRGVFGWNVGDMGQFLGEASKVVLAASEPLVIFGHSLGGLQATWLANHFPKQVKYVFAIASPIRGLDCPDRQQNFLDALNVTPEQFIALRDIYAPGIKDHLTTISSATDIVCPASQCYVEGADNHIVQMTDEEKRLFPALSTHLVLPYLKATKQCILEKL